MSTSSWACRARLYFGEVGDGSSGVVVVMIKLMKGGYVCYNGVRARNKGIRKRFGAGVGMCIFVYGCVCVCVLIRVKGSSSNEPCHDNG